MHFANARKISEKECVQRVSNFSFDRVHELIIENVSMFIKKVDKRYTGWGNNFVHLEYHRYF